MERHYKKHCTGCVQDGVGMGWPIYCPECEKLNQKPDFQARLQSFFSTLWIYITNHDPNDPRR